VDDFVLKRPSLVKRWLKQVIAAEGGKEMAIDYVFCTDERLLSINNEYLKHDYFTDIITFDVSFGKEGIYSDIFISCDRVKENADELKTDFEDELHRVMVHGILHLLGYKDKSKKDELAMRGREDYWLEQRSLI